MPVAAATAALAVDEPVEEVLDEELVVEWVLVKVLVAVAEPAELVRVVSPVVVVADTPPPFEAREARYEAALYSLLAIMEASEANWDCCEAEALLVSVLAREAHEVASTDASLARLEAWLAQRL